MKKALFVLFAASLFVFSLGIQQAHAQIMPDLELVLAVDVSSSVSESEFDLMMQGYANAFDPTVNTDIVDIIQTGNNGAIGVSLFLFSEGQYQLTKGTSDWWNISNATTATNFSTAVAALDFNTVVYSSGFGYDTDISSAINYATGLFPGDADKQVIDISGNGRDDTTSSELAGAITNALNNGVDTINGIAIGDADLLSYFQGNVIAGQDAFAMQAADFSDFNEAIRRKLEREIPPPVPEPMSLMLMGSGLLGMLGLRRKK